MPAPAVAPVEAVQSLASPQLLSQPTQSHRATFASMLLDGLERADRKLADADALARAFALDDSIPVHQVTFALEQARLTFELLQQVRARLVGGYQELMRMQL
jgi:flagellar hook-basal body complex protein FliE